MSAVDRLRRTKHRLWLAKRHTESISRDVFDRVNRWDDQLRDHTFNAQRYVGRDGQWALDSFWRFDAADEDDPGTVRRQISRSGSGAMRCLRTGRGVWTRSCGGTHTRKSHSSPQTRSRTMWLPDIRCTQRSSTFQRDISPTTSVGTSCTVTAAVTATSRSLSPIGRPPSRASRTTRTSGWSDISSLPPRIARESSRTSDATCASLGPLGRKWCVHLPPRDAVDHRVDCRAGATVELLRNAPEAAPGTGRVRNESRLPVALDHPPSASAAAASTQVRATPGSGLGSSSGLGQPSVNSRTGNWIVAQRRRIDRAAPASRRAVAGSRPNLSS